MIKSHTSEGTFVRTDAVNKALVCLNENGLVFLIGSPGIGKSRIGLELIRQLSIDDGRFRCIQLDDISEWNDMSDGMIAVLIDDVFGRTNNNYNDDVHSKSIKLIFTTIQNKNIKVVLTLRKNIYQTIVTNTPRLRILLDPHVLDLSSHKHQMTVEEKKSCLIKYLTKNKILVTDDLKKENINDDSILNTGTTVYLHEMTVRKILQSDTNTQIGFPETCYLFASDRKFTKQGHNFFCHPTEQLLKEMENLRIDGETNKGSMVDFTLLAYILVNGDSLNTDKINTDEFKKLMKTIYLNPLLDILTSHINNSAKQLLGKYLKINNDGNYCFQHRLISEAVMMSYSVVDPRTVIPLLGFDFITEMARPQSYRPSEGEVIFSVPVSCYSLLALRLLQLLETDYMKYPYQFVQNLCNSKIITMTSDNILQEMINQYKFNKSYHYWSFLSDHRFSKRYIVSISEFYLPSALLMFCNINPFPQSLYDKIRITLTPESNGDVIEESESVFTEEAHSGVMKTSHRKTGESNMGVMKSCKESLVRVFKCCICSEDGNIHNTPPIQESHEMEEQGSDVIEETHNNQTLESHLMEGTDGFGMQETQNLLTHKYVLVRALKEDTVIEACKQTLIESFNFAICTLDETRSTVILKILKDLNIKEYKPPEEFCSNIIRCQGVPGVQLLLSFHDKYQFFNITEFLCEIFRSLTLDEINIDDNMKQWITSVITDNKDDLELVKAVMGFVCHKGQLDFVKDVCGKFDSSLFDVDDMITRACSGNNTDVIQWLVEKYYVLLYNLQRVLNKACSDGNMAVLQVILNMSDHTLLDMNSLMDIACMNGNTELIEWLCENFDIDLFDMKTVMNVACSSWRGDTELVKWLCEKFGNKVFDMKIVMNEVCIRGRTELIIWLCEKFDHHLFDMKMVMYVACRKGNSELVKWLFEKFDISLFDMQATMNVACSILTGNSELVKWLCDNFDNNLFDMKTALNKACGSGETELVKWLCEKFDNRLFCMETAMNAACSSGNIELIKWLCENFDKNLFDMKTAMNVACGNGMIELVIWFFEEFDNNLFDMKTALNAASRYGRLELVIWLCQHFDNNLFDMNTAMNAACIYDRAELIVWLREKL